MLIEKVESLIKRMRWRAFFFLRGKDGDSTDAEDAYPRLNSRKCPPQVDELVPFENDMLRLIESIEFRRVSDPFQDALAKDIRDMKQSADIIVRADKTRNLYKVPVAQYDKLLHDNVTKFYKSAPDSLYEDINSEAQQIAHRLDLADRMDTLAKSEAFLTLKDHKENFTTALPCRLINPSKPEMGIVSKRILESAVHAVREGSRVNLWRNTAAVINWFQGIEGKKDCSFLRFDIVDFYPSISEDLLRQAVDFAKDHVGLTDAEVEIIFHARKSLLFVNGRTWMKRDRDGTFDVTMGCYDGAEVCELVGVFLLNKLAPLFGNNDLGLYRDDGLATLRKASARDSDSTRKNLTSTMKRYGLRITVEINAKTTDFLDVTLDLETGRYFPYRKSNDRPLYINKSSNHPPNILRNLPAAISRRVSSISCDQQAFLEAAPTYEEALAASGFPGEMKFIPANQQTKKRQRQRNVTWFNPPYSKSVKTNVGHRFLSLVSKHFPKESTLHKIFNKHTLKVSYSCLPNVASNISSANRKLRSAPSVGRACNCRVKDNCPLNGECQAECVVYKAAVTDPETGNEKDYIGLTAPSFKLRYANHLTSMRHERYEQRTELAKHVWTLKRGNVDPSISWSIIARAPAYNASSKKCHLCLSEKLAIILWPKEKRLNKRPELVSTCRHHNKVLLANFTRIT